MAGPEIRLLEALDHIVAGRKPPNYRWADPRAVGPKIQQGGALAGQSPNWAKLGMVVVLAYIVNGWRLPPSLSDADDWIWDWWDRCLRDSLNGLALYKESGSRRYSIWSMLAVLAVNWLTLKLDHRDLHTASWTWLVAFWSMISLAAYTKPYRPRYTDDRPDAPLSTVVGERSWIYRKAKGIGPGVIEREPCGILLGDLLGGYRARLDGIERRIWDRCAPKAELSQVVRAPWRQLVEQIGAWGPGGDGWLPGQTLHVLRWRDGSVASVISACRGQSTAPLYALGVVDGEIRALYADSGERKTPNIEPGRCEALFDPGTGRAVAYAERAGVADSRLAPGDASAFDHPDRNTRSLALHPGGSPILYHVAIGPRGAKIVYDGDAAGQEDPPAPPEPPQPPVSDDVPDADEIEWARKIEREGRGSNSARYHAAAIAILLHRQVSAGDDDLSPLAGHARQLARILQ